ncbi:integrase, catalytic region, zinc finger, CCHC-type containing protein [Tanacetum coccineum]
MRFTQLINDMNIYKMKLEQFQLNAYIEQHELHANEVRIMRERNQDPLALVVNHQMTPSYFNTYQLHQDACPQPQSIPQIEYIISTVNQQTHLVKFPHIDSGLAVPVFKQGDDPIDGINKMMSFMSTIVSSCFPNTTNQLKNSSNPRQQVNKELWKCFNCQWEGHMARQCPKPKRKRDATWFKDKFFLVEAQGSAYQADDLDAYDSDFDDFSTAKAVLMANLSSYGSDVLSRVPHSENTHSDMLNQSVQEMPYYEQTHLVNYPENEIISDSNIIPYS